MTLTIRTFLPATLASLVLFAVRLPAWANPSSHRIAAPAPSPAASLTGRIERFSPRVRRATISYLRLRLLELREEDLERARAAIERRLSVDELLAPAAPAETNGPAARTHAYADE